MALTKSNWYIVTIAVFLLFVTGFYLFGNDLQSKGMLDQNSQEYFSDYSNNFNDADMDIDSIYNTNINNYSSIDALSEEEEGEQINTDNLGIFKKAQYTITQKFSGITSKASSVQSFFKMIFFAPNFIMRTFGIVNEMNWVNNIIGYILAFAGILLVMKISGLGGNS